MLKPSFRSRFLKVAKWYLMIFVLMFAFRIWYGYVNEAGQATDHSTYDFFSNMDNLRKNYASEGKKFKAIAIPQQVTDIPQNGSNQKYEKTATVRSKTSQFDKDMQSVKKLAGAFDGVIQYEQNLGNKGDREMHLLIGIVPEKFDSFYVQVQKVGLVKSMVITKVDKTNEFRQLNAKKLSLEKTLQSLVDLKARGGTIVDYLALNDKILEMESQLQELGVELGNFDTENEFCSIRYSLFEGEVEKKITVIGRIKVALEWTIKYYLMLMVISLLLVVAVFISVLAIEKLNILKSIADKIRE